MSNKHEMSKFLYTIVKQLDLKSIDWNQVSSELGITNGHAARMRYSRFKQQMEGNAPVRRPRNPNAKRVSKQKRPKDEEKKVKLEDGTSMNDPMATSSPSAQSLDASQEPSQHMTSEAAVVKLEPPEDSVTAELASVIASAEYNIDAASMSVQMMNAPEQVDQSQQTHAESLHCENVADFSFDLHDPQAQHQQTMFSPMVPQQHEMMTQNLSHNMGMADHRGFEPFMGMDMYSGMNEIGGHGPMMVPMVKAEERWDASYGQA